jgi:mannose-1-phosphate guanylyltransferase
VIHGVQWKDISLGRAWEYAGAHEQKEARVYNIVVMAGGKGERFWPKSDVHKPKQFQRIVSDRTMMQETFFRVYPEVSAERIFIVAGERFREVIVEQLPDLRPQSLIVEPVGKNTAPAIGLAAVYLLDDHRDEVMVVLTADHVLKPKHEFLRAVEAAASAAEGGSLVTFGISPNRPAVEYGYIEIGKVRERIRGLEVYDVEKFHEKPSLECASEYVRSGKFLWNAGLFAFTVSALLGSMKTHMPRLYEGLMCIHESIGTKREEAVKKEEFAQFESISVDYGIMEKARNIVCVRPSFLWDDVGSWGSVARHREKDTHGNVSQGQVMLIDAKDNIVLGDDESLISLIGLSDVIVVKEGHKILIAHRSQDQRVKEVVQRIDQNKNYSKFR